MSIKVFKIWDENCLKVYRRLVRYKFNSIPFLDMILKSLLIKRTKKIFLVASNFHEDKVSFE